MPRKQPSSHLKNPSKLCDIRIF